VAKKNFRTIPERILNKAKEINNQYLVVSCMITVTKAQIQDGLFRHLNIEFSNDKLQFPETIIPNESQGKYSHRNVNGFEVIRKDLKKIRTYRTIDVPNYGDSWRGTHTVDIPQEIYPRDFYSPRLINLLIECSNKSQNLDKYSIKFQLDEVLDKESTDFEKRLFELINLLQENVYDCDIMSASSSFQDYLSTVQLAWEILPPGNKEIIIKKLIGGNSNPEQNKIVDERYTFMMGLNPRDLIVGSSGLQRYLGALINDNLVVFENIHYGNAIYVMFENWQELSQKNRVDLISGRFGDNFIRVLHKSGWKSIVKKIINKKLKNK
jgi:hypothetical protein